MVKYNSNVLVEKKEVLIMTIVVKGNETCEITYMCDCDGKGWS